MTNHNGTFCIMILTLCGWEMGQRFETRADARVMVRHYALEITAGRRMIGGMAAEAVRVKTLAEGRKMIGTRP